MFVVRVSITVWLQDVYHVQDSIRLVCVAFLATFLVGCHLHVLKIRGATRFRASLSQFETRFFSGLMI